MRNQREHLILLLANVHIRLKPKPEPLNKVCITYYYLVALITLFKLFFNFDFYLIDYLRRCSPRVILASILHLDSVFLCGNSCLIVSFSALPLITLA